MRAAALTLFLAAAQAASSAWACGVCVEDKIAAVYDHAVVQEALAAKRTVVFFAIEGNLVAGEDSKRSIAQAARTTSGIDAKSVRVSVELASLALAFDPRRANLAAVEKHLEAKLAPMGISLLTLQVKNP